MTGNVDRELRLHVDGAIATLWLDRPDKRNALALRHWERLAALVAGVDAERSIRVLFVRSTQPAVFSAGADIDEFAEARADAASAAAYTAAFDVGVAALSSVRMPTVAVVQGLCFGGGLEIVQACDVTIADETARFGLSPASLGIVYPFEASRRLMAAWGARQARYMLSTGKTVDAERAHVLGVVAEVVHAADIESAVADLGRRISALSPIALAAMKTIVSAIAADHADSARLASEAISAAIESTDYAEGLAAFAQKRPPSFG